MTFQTILDAALQKRVVERIPDVNPPLCPDALLFEIVSARAYAAVALSQIRGDNSLTN